MKPIFYAVYHFLDVNNACIENVGFGF